MKTAQAASNRAVAPSPTPSQPKQVSTSPTTSTDAGKGSGGTSTGETSTQNERLPEDYRYSASSEPTFEDTSSYFGGTGGIDGGDYGTRG